MTFPVHVVLRHRLTAVPGQPLRRAIERMEKDLFPGLGSLPLAGITAPVLLDVTPGSPASRLQERSGSSELGHDLSQIVESLAHRGLQLVDLVAFRETVDIDFAIEVGVALDREMHAAELSAG